VSPPNPPLLFLNVALHRFRDPKKGVFLMMRFERDPIFFLFNVALPVFLIALCSLASILIEDDDPLYEAAVSVHATLLAQPSSSSARRATPRHATPPRALACATCTLLLLSGAC